MAARSLLSSGCMRRVVLLSPRNLKSVLHNPRMGLNTSEIQPRTGKLLKAMAGFGLVASGLYIVMPESMMEELKKVVKNIRDDFVVDVETETKKEAIKIVKEIVENKEINVEEEIEEVGIALLDDLELDVEKEIEKELTKIRNSMSEQVSDSKGIITSDLPKHPLNKNELDVTASEENVLPMLEGDKETGPLKIIAEVVDDIKTGLEIVTESVDMISEVVSEAKQIENDLKEVI